MLKIYKIPLSKDEFTTNVKLYHLDVVESITTPNPSNYPNIVEK
jgi:hypothetical protein